MTGREAWRALGRLLRPSWRRVLLGALFLGMQAILLLPITVLVKDIFSSELPAGDAEGVVVRGAGIVGLYLGSAALSLVARRLILVAIFTRVAALRLGVLEQLHRLPLAWHARQDLTTLYALQVQDGERLEASLPALVPLAQAVVVGLPLAVVAVVVSPLLAAVMVLVIPGMVLLNSWLKSRTEVAIKLWIIDHRAFGAHVMRTLRSMNLIRTAGADDGELRAAADRVTALRRTSLGKFWASNLSQVLQGTIAAVVGGLILVVGGVAMTRDMLSLGDLLAFYAVTALLLRNVTGAAGSLQEVAVATSALIPLQAIVDETTPPVYTGTSAGDFDGSMTLRGVVFGHDATPVLRGIDLEVRAGERVALVGANGSGKSTLVRLLLGLDRPWEGEVRAGGTPLEDLDVSGMRRGIGVVGQRPYLRPGSIRANVCFGHPDADPEAFAWAVEVSGVGQLVPGLADGLDTVVGDDGVLLSGGQQQSISIARALVGRPRLLVLDEPTNHLDQVTIARLLAALDSWAPRPTVLVITHNHQLAGWADRTLLLSEGRLRVQPPKYAVEIS